MVKEVAELLGYTERAIRNKVYNHEYKTKLVNSSTGRGGKNILILLESLPEQAQKAYHNQVNGNSQFVVNTDYTSTAAQKKKGELRSNAVSEHKKYSKEAIKGGMTRKGDIRKAFIVKWNKEHPDFQITSKSLYDWEKKSKSGQVEKLVDRRGGYNRGKCSIPDKYIILFDSLYLQETKPTLESCFKEVQYQADIDGEYIPGIKAFRNHVKNMNKAMVIKAREGDKAFTDKCLPYFERDYSLLTPNQYWVSDHHLWDVFVRVLNNRGEWKLARPWGSYWMDMRTRKIMSSIIRIEPPNSDIVLCSFGLAVEHFGIPSGVRLDNGKDYKARDLFYPEGHYIVSDEEKNNIESSLAANLGIEVVYSIPYNAKAKPIERAFNTFEEQLGKKYASYAGSDAKKRPENLKILDIMDYPTLDEFIEFHNRYIYEIYNESPHKGNGMDGKSPNQVYKDIPFTIRRASKEVLYFSLMRVKGQRVVGKQGITFNNVHYWHENCVEHFGTKIIARYDPTKPEILYIFDTNSNFLFVAEEVQKQGWNLTDEDYQRENHRKKIAKQKALNAYTKDNVIRSTESIRDRLQRQADSIDKAGIADSKVFEVVRNEKLEETAKLITMSDIDRNYRNVINRNNSRKKNVSERQKLYADKFKEKMLDRANQKQA